MAVYNPQLTWFKELLHSLSEQDFLDLEWIIIDDSSDKISYSELTDLISKYAYSQDKKIPYKILKNDKNVGSNETYRKLISLAKGEYIAFCDQDDIWKKNKLSRLYEEISKQRGILVYSDMSIIDSKGMLIKGSYHNERRGFGHISGEEKTGDLLVRNFIPGCSIMVSKDILNKYGNIPKGTYWDHWLNIIASTQGKILYLSETLMYYRIHGTNQTGRFNNIYNKGDYYIYRLIPLYARMIEMKERKIHFKGEDKVYEFVKARLEKKLFRIWKYRSCGKMDAYFEMFLIISPECIVKKVFKWIRK